MALPRNVPLALVSVAKRAIEPRRPLSYQRLAPLSSPQSRQTHCRNNNDNNPSSSSSSSSHQMRHKSSVPCPPSSTTTAREHLDSVRERATHNASAFDAAHPRLSANDTLFSSWRTRQTNATKRNPVRPHPKSPPNLIAPPSSSPSSLPPSFFPSYAHSGRVGPPSFPPDHVLIHDGPSIERMTRAARLARRLLDRACHPAVVRPGTTTQEIDDALRSATLRRGAYPSPLNYHGFPKSVCSSINEVVCHGIPDSRPLEMGDVVSFDVSCYLGGVHGDNCATVVVGDVEEGWSDDGEEFSWDEGVGEGGESDETANNAADCTVPPRKDWPSVDAPLKKTFASTEEEERFVTARRLVQAALESRDEGVAACRPGGCLSEIGGAIHAVADAYGYDTVRHYRGHGISSDFHCAPFVKHYRNNDVMELLPGMIFTIEPMITEGSAECDEWSDDWTVATRDGGRAAQFEHTVLVTETGVQILTLP